MKNKAIVHLVLHGEPGQPGCLVGIKELESIPDAKLQASILAPRRDGNSLYPQSCATEFGVVNELMQAAARALKGGEVEAIVLNEVKAIGTDTVPQAVVKVKFDSLIAALDPDAVRGVDEQGNDKSKWITVGSILNGQALFAEPIAAAAGATQS